MIRPTLITREVKRRHIHLAIAASRLILAISTMLASSVALAQDVYWDGSESNNWDNANNWTPVTVPSDAGINGPIAVFSLVHQLHTINLNTNRGVRGVRFENTQNVTIQNSGGELFIGGSGPGGGITVNPESNGTINAPINLIISQVWKNNSGHDLTINGRVDNNGALLHIAGDGGMDHEGQVVLNGRLIGAGGLMVDSGTLATVVLANGNNNNTYAGGTFLYGGTLRVGHDGNLGGASSNIEFNGGTLLTSGPITTSRAVILAGAGTINTNDFNSTFNGGFGGAGSLTKVGGGRLILTADNSFTGGTNINDGTIRFDSLEALPSEGTDLIIHSAGRAIFGAQNGALLAFGRNHQVQTLNGGTLEFGNTTPGSLTTLSGSVVLNAPSTITNTGGFLTIGQISGPISGDDQLNIGTIGGSGVIQLASAGTHTGEVRIKSGGLRLAHSNALAQSTLHMIGGENETGTLEFSGISTATLGALLGSRDIALPGVNLSIGANNASQTYIGAFTGNGAITKVGSGVQTLTGSSNYSGGTTIAGGTLIINNPSNLGTGSLTLSGGGTLKVTQGVSWNRFVILNGTGGAIDTNGTQSDFTQAFSGTGVLKKAGGGNLTLYGNNQSHSGGTIIDVGTINYTTPVALPNSGTIQVNPAGTLALGSVGAFGGQQITLGGGNLLFTNAGGPLTTLGANISLTAESTVTSNGGSFIVAQINGVISGPSNAPFNTNGTVMLANANTFFGDTRIVSGGLLLNHSNALANSTLHMAAGHSGELDFRSLTEATLGGLAGTRGITLQNISGPTGPVALSIGNNNVSGNDYSGVLSGTGSLTKVGSGTQFISGANTFSGETKVSGGTLLLNNPLALRNSTLDYNNYGGVLGFNGVTSVTLGGLKGNQNLSLNNGSSPVNLIVGNNNLNTTYSGALSSNGSLTKIGSGTLTLTGVNIYSGVTTISAGTLQIGNGGSSGNVPNGGITNNSALIFNHNNSYTYSGEISGTGTVTQLSGIMTLVYGSNSYIGDTVIEGGILRGGVIADYGTVSSFGRGSSAPSCFTISSGGTLQYAGGTAATNRSISLGSGGGAIDVENSATTLTWSGLISGTGSLTKTGAYPGTLTLTNANTYSGGTTINEGILVAANAVGSATGTGPITVRRVLQIGNGGTVGAVSGNVFLDGGYLSFDRTNDVTFANQVSGTGYLYKYNPTTLILTGNNSYTAETVIRDGVLVAANATGSATGTSLITVDPPATLRIGDSTGPTGGTVGSVSAAVINNNGSVVFDRTNDVIYGGQINGLGQLYKYSGGVLTLTGTNGYTGGTTINGGTLRGGTIADFGIASAFGAGNFAINHGSTLRYAGNSASTNRTISLGGVGGVIDIENPSATLTASGLISGSDLIKVGPGTLALTASNSYNGRTIVLGGALAVSSESNLGTSELTLNGGILRTTSSATFSRRMMLDVGDGIIETNGFNSVYNGQIVGPGDFVIEGAGSLTLTNLNNTYSGRTGVYNGGTLAASSDLQLGTNDLALNGGTFRTLSSAHFNRRMTIDTVGGGTIDTNGFDPYWDGDIDWGGDLTKKGTGTLTLTGISDVGDSHVEQGTLRVESGGQLNADQFIRVGSLSSNTASGAMIVTGTGSRVTAASSLVVGSDSDGSLTISGGATAVTWNGNIGNNLAGSYHPNGVATVTGVGSSWMLDNQLTVANQANGTLIVENGGHVSSEGETIVGNFAGSDGDVTVTGSGSILGVTSALTVGNNGSGSLTVSGGAAVNSNNGFLATNSGSTGFASVSGAGSTWSSSDLFVGGGISAAGGAGTLTVENGGKVDVANSLKLWNQGTVNLSSGGMVNVGSPTGASLPDAIRVWSGGAIRGNGTIQGDVVSDGRVAPGNSPGILTINGDYTQTNSSILEIEVGALTPGPGPVGNPNAGHDQVRVGGVATLGGVYEFPIINGFVPQAGDEITFIETFDVDGPAGPIPPGSIVPGTLPHDATAPGLDAANPDLAIRIVSTPGVGGNVKLEFVPETEIFFDGNGATPNWFIAGTDTNWDLSRNPIDSDKTTVENVTGLTQVVSINSSGPTGPEAVVNRLVVGDVNGPAIGDITVAVESGFELKTQVGDVTIGDRGTIELDAALLSAPASQKVDIQNGGLLAGNGTIKAGDLVISAGTLRPGFSVGHMDVEGNYEQQTDGTLLIDIESGAQFDSIDVTGVVQLGGTLRIDASNSTTLNSGLEFDIITGGSLEGEFDSIQAIGNNNIYFKEEYKRDIGTLSLVQYSRGDMNGIGGITEADYDLFVFGLMNASVSRYFAECNCDILPQQGGDFSGNGRLDFDDIPGFQNQLAGMGMSTLGLSAAFERYFSNVPEPSSVVLLLGAGCWIVTVRCRDRGNKRK